MIRMKTVMFAGAALGIAGVASAQDANRSRAYSAELLADAEEHSSLLQAGSSGYDDAFYIQSSDGNFRMDIDAIAQFRYNFNLLDESAGDDVVNGFQFARARLNFEGHAVTPELRYRIEGSFGAENPNPAFFTLRNGYIEYDYGNNWTVRGGQFRAPFLFERLVEPHQLQTIDRSNASRPFDLGFVEGVQATYNSDGGWRAMVAFTDGANTIATPFNSTGTLATGNVSPTGPSNARQSDVALTGRFEYLVDGSWDQFQSYSNGPQGEDGLLVGGAAHIQFGDDGAGGSSQDSFLFTADAAYQTANGWNAAGAFHYRSLETATTDTSDVAFVLQGGYYFTDSLEGYARFDTVVADMLDDFTTVTGGVNYYPIDGTQAFRVTGEVQYFADGTTGSIVGPSAVNGVAASGTDASIGLGAQFQVAF